MKLPDIVGILRNKVPFSADVLTKFSKGKLTERKTAILFPSIEIYVLPAQKNRLADTFFLEHITCDSDDTLNLEDQILLPLFETVDFSVGCAVVWLSKLLFLSFCLGKQCMP